MMDSIQRPRFIIHQTVYSDILVFFASLLSTNNFKSMIYFYLLKIAWPSNYSLSHTFICNIHLCKWRDIVLFLENYWEQHTEFLSFHMGMLESLTFSFIKFFFSWLWLAHIWSQQASTLMGFGFSLRSRYKIVKTSKVPFS